MKARDKAKKVAQFTRESDDLSYYRKLRNLVTNVVRKNREMDDVDL